MSVTTNKGFIAGLFMCVILFILMSLGYTGGEGVSYLKYAPLAVILGIYLSALSKEHKEFYKSALIHGLKISAIAGLVLSVSNLIVYLIEPSLSVSKYNLVPSQFFEAMAVSATLLFEVTVLGMILTFIFFQMFKNGNTEVS